MEKSKIPVPKSFPAEKPSAPDNDFPYPSQKKACPQKPTYPLYSKDPNLMFATSDDNVVFKATNNGKRAVVTKKAAAPTRGPVNRYRMEAELKDKNQLLEASNASLHNNLTSAQKKIEQVTEDKEKLQEEIKELNRRLEKSLIILESRNIDPVSGERILTSTEAANKLRSETKVFTENLLKELTTFNQTASEQKALVQTVMAKLKQAEEGRSHFVKEQETFQTELDQFKASLQEAEKWLDS
ncbi:small kinetochore-associated protein [Discoglossus pictus]